MLGRSWGFTVIMEESRRRRAAEYLRGEREMGQHGPATGSWARPPTLVPHLEDGGTAMGFCTARATLSPFWKTMS